MIQTYKARRPCTIGHETRDPGLPVPEAHTWRLTDGLVSGGVLEPLELSEEDFQKAVEEYCPDLADQIYEILGLRALGTEAFKTQTRRTGKKGVLASIQAEEITPESGRPVAGRATSADG